MRQAARRGFAEDHRLHAAEDRGKSDPERSEQNRRRQGCSRIAVVRIRNSLANTPKGGSPSIASAPSIKPHPIVGESVMSPRMFSMSCDPAFCAA